MRSAVPSRLPRPTPCPHRRLRVERPLKGPLHEGRRHRRRWPRRPGRRMEAAALGHGAPGVRQPGRRPHPVGATRSVLAELGWACVRRPGIVHRRAPVRGEGGAGARLAGGRGDGRGSCRRGRSSSTYPMPLPVAPSRSSRRAKKGAGRSCGTRASCGNAAARTRPCASSGSTTPPPQLPGLRGATCPRTPVRCSSRKTWSAADPHQISAGAGIGYFSLVWNIGQGLNRNIVGWSVHPDPGHRHGPGRAGAARRRGRRDRAHQALGRRGTASTGWTTRSRGAASSWPPRRRSATASPSTWGRTSARPWVRTLYGPYVSAAFLTDESTPQPWDAAYGIATPKWSFNIVLNQASLVRGSESMRQPVGSIMTFSPAGLACTLLPEERRGDHTN